MYQMLQQPHVYPSLPAEKANSAREAGADIPRVAHANARLRLSFENISLSLNIG
jgi:hypothetical protein